MKKPGETAAAKQVKKVLLGRTVAVFLGILLQICWCFFLMYYFSNRYTYVNAILQVLAVIIVFYIINKGINPAYKLVWTIVILISPVLGLTIYYLFGRSKLTKKTAEEMRRVHLEANGYLPNDKDNEDALRRESVSCANQSKYISDWSGYPLYAHTASKYYPCGEDMFADMLEDLKEAKHFIFLEYFIMAEGVMFDEILAILKEKVQEGVEVRMIYDDLGCCTCLPPKFYRQLTAMGIRCVTFNRLRPVMSVIMNNRDHRKIFVVDGKVAYTGGLNLADEYINVKQRFGYWKDTGIRMEGEAVWSLTLMFLEMWNYITHSTEEYQLYHPSRFMEQWPATDGYLQPYSDSPLEKEKVGENIYMNLIAHAREYLYIFTPYLILDNEMLTLLRNAAKSGVDVRIVTPHVPDKKLIFWMTQSNYQRLLECGIRIYQYTPGFLHAKSFVCDDRVGTVGSVNMDFRSLYLHFECGVWMYDTSVIAQMKQDACDTMAASQEITLEFCQNQHVLKRLIWSMLRLFAPLV